MDPVNRRQMAGFTKAIPQRIYVLAQIKLLGRRWHMAEGMAMAQILSNLDEQCLLDWEEAFIDGSFAPAKKGALGLAKPKGAKDRSGWW